MSVSLQEDATGGQTPAWLTQWQSMLSDVISEGDATEENFLRMFRKLLESPEHDAHAVEQAAKDIRDYYTTHYNADKPGFSRMPAGGAGYVMEVVSSHAFDLAGALFPGDVNHNRLGSLLVELKTHAAKTLDSEVGLTSKVSYVSLNMLTWVQTPELGYDATGLLITIRDHWNHDHGLVRDNETSVSRCDEWIAVSSLIARLLGENMLRGEEISLATEDIKECLKSSTETSLSELTRNCRILVAANWVLLAGPQLFEEVKSDPQGRAGRLAPDTCKKLAIKLDEVASRSTEPSEEHSPAHWKLKDRVVKAMQTMKELDPTLFGHEASNIDNA